MQTVIFMQFVCEVLLIYTGVTTATTDENDENVPSQDPIMFRLQRHFSVANTDDLKTGFFFTAYPTRKEQW